MLAGRGNRDRGVWGFSKGGRIMGRSEGLGVQVRGWDIGTGDLVVGGRVSGCQSAHILPSHMCPGIGRTFPSGGV